MYFCTYLLHITVVLVHTPCGVSSSADKCFQFKSIAQHIISINKKHLSRS